MGNIDLNIQLSVVNFLFDILGGLLVLFLAYTIYEIKPKIKNIFFIILILAIVTTLTVKATTELGKYIILIKYIKPLIVLIVKVILVKYLINFNFRQSLIICTYNSLIMVLGEITVYLLMKLQNYDPLNVWNGITDFTLSNFIIYVIAFILAFIGKGLHIISKLPKNVRPKAYKYIIINIAISFVIIYPHVLGTLFNYKSEFLTTIFILAVMLSLSMDIFSINNIANTEIREQELELQKFYNSSMSEIIDRLRIYKHDTGNMLNTINGYIKLKHYDKLAEYMSEVTADIMETDNLMAIRNINNAALYGIISSKVNRAAGSDIHMQVFIIGEVNEIPNIKISNLCEILGIFLDNAIEACIESSKKIVNLTIKNNDDYTQFLIENSFNEDKMNLEKLGQQGYSTKGNNRGMGLYIVNRLLAKNKNVTTKTSIEFGYFKQELTIRK